MFSVLVVCFCLLLVRESTAGVDGDICLLPSGDEGRCTKIRNCAEAEDLKFRSATKICGYDRDDVIICCPRNTDQIDGCPPKTPRRPDMKFGRTAFEKCVEYQEQVVFPCSNETVVSLSDGREVKHRRGGCYDPPPLVVGSDGIDASRGQFPHMVECVEYQESVVYPCTLNKFGKKKSPRRKNGCYDKYPLIQAGYDGYDASRGQFPHMALLGYGNDSSSVEWSCGGTIISERFILTAGHCTVHRILGQVSLARLGILKRSDPMLITRLYKITRIVTHPDYLPPKKYNDIALLETEKKIVFVNKFVLPACLDIEDDPPKDHFASATGWGALGEWGGIANVLQIMDLMKFSVEECSQHYPQGRLMPRGIDNHTQICYGHRYRPTDTCQGDSGGPLQTEYRPVECMHKVVGVTSFGKSCGRTEQPGIYTRVRAYVPWIESVVWPEK